MEQPVRTSGMPRGCFIALMIVGALVVVLVIIGSLICFNKDKVLRWSVKEGVGYVKKEINKKPVEGVDTVQFDRLADSFLVRIETASFTDSAGVQFVTTMQSGLLDKRIDREDVDRLSSAMVRMYPDLAPLSPGVPEPQTPAPVDTGAVMHDTVRSVPDTNRDTTR